MTRRHSAWAAGAVTVVLFVAACTSEEGAVSEPETVAATEAAPGTAAATTAPAAAPESGCADVIDVAVDSGGDGNLDFAVTVRSSDTGDDKYADAWEVRSGDGAVLGTRILTHPHVGEQPFTRSLNAVDVPAELDEVVVAARDSVSGFCGATMTVTVPRG